MQEPAQSTPIEAQLNERGGYISFDRTYRSGCAVGYKIKLTFSKSLSILQPGETFRATLNCEDRSPPCGYKWRIADLFAANIVSKVERFPNYVYNENIQLISSSNCSSGVNDFKQGMRTNIFTLKYEPKKQVPLTAIQLTIAGDHKIYFVFESGGQPTTMATVQGKPDLSCAWKSTYGGYPLG